MPLPLIAAVAAPVAGALAGKVLGPKNQTATAAVPPDLAAMRANTTGLLNHILFGTTGPNLTSGAPSQLLSQIQNHTIPGLNGTTQDVFSKLAQQLQDQGVQPTGTPAPNFGGSSGAPQIGGAFNPSALLPHFAQGGQVQGNTDTVPAMLTPGEMVMNRAAVKILGPDFLQKLNAVLCKPGQAMSPHHYANGGMVKGYAAGGLVQGPGAQPMTAGGGPTAQPSVPGAGGGSFDPSKIPQNFGNGGGLGGWQDSSGQIHNGPFQGGGPTTQPSVPGAGGFKPNIDPAPPPAGGGGALPSATPNGSPATDRLQQYFGNLGVPFTGLQNTAAQSANRMLTQQSPEQRALEAANPFLQQTGIDQGAQNRFLQGATQSGLNPGSSNFFQNLLTNGAGNLGPGANVSGILGQIGQNGGNIAGQSGANGGLGPTGYLNGVLNQNPATGVDQLLQPQYQQALAQANEQGGRFGSANALQRGQVAAAHDADLANRLQTGVNQQLTASGQLGQLAQAQRQMQLQAAMAGTQNQLNAAGTLGGFNQQGALAGLQAQLGGAGTLGSLGLSDIGQQLGAAGQLGNLGIAGQQTRLQGLGLGGNLAGQAGNADRANTQQGYNIGTAQANQQDIGTQRNLQTLLQLLGLSAGASYNVPTSVSPSGAQQGAAVGGGIGNSIAAMAPWLQGGNNAIPPAPNVNVNGAGNVNWNPIPVPS